MPASPASGPSNRDKATVRFNAVTGEGASSGGRRRARESTSSRSLLHPPQRACTAAIAACDVIRRHACAFGAPFEVREPKRDQLPDPSGSGPDPRAAPSLPSSSDPWRAAEQLGTPSAPTSAWPRAAGPCCQGHWRRDARDATASRQRSLPDQRFAGVRRVALVEHQVDHFENRVRALRPSCRMYREGPMRDLSSRTSRFARTSRCAIVGPETRNARAISATLNPPTVFRLRATRASGEQRRMAAHEHHPQLVVFDSVGDLEMPVGDVRLRDARRRSHPLDERIAELRLSTSTAPLRATRAATRPGFRAHRCTATAGAP